MAEVAVQTPASLVAPRVVINYIHGGPLDDIHSFKCQRQRLLRAAFVRERVNSVQRNFTEGSVCPIDDIVTFPLVDSNRVLQAHEDALVLTLGVGSFDVRRILVDLGSSANLLQMSAYK